MIHQLEMKLGAQARALLMKHGDLTLPQWRIIRVIGMDAADGSTAIRKVLGFDKSQFSKTVSQLQARSLVEVLDHPTDRRQFRLALTDEGRAVLCRLTPELDARNNFLMQALSSEERSLIRSALMKLSLAAETTDIPTGTDT
ncbi:winged helix-turn-helix transcriptional regulator [Donghicola sp. C2-DW-16]|uniref:Winged helix-turn-helix transcriptional regulator n=2 Tax=Donghicola mangrovi TaxID=2729614 RepID=A0ABX2PC35_9RHOB|nr:MarR family winged helix-turn-helix transcriptional regulator [Donghicola mangrovi]NVO26735.1 winged helix-turn-helix transcriptional regulator [Donghicola mangrovi]